jgi:AcrR family transcriptional regulator
MDSSTRRTKGVQRGARSQQVVEKVRAATMAELARVGFGGLTIEGVAKAANVNRTTIYRRWPSKSALLLAVLEPGLQRFDHGVVGDLAGRDLALRLANAAEFAVGSGRGSVLAGHHGIGDMPDAVDFHPDGVARLQEPPGRPACSGEGSTGDDVAGFQGAELAELADHLGGGEDQVCDPAALAQFAIEVGA